MKTQLVLMVLTLTLFVLFNQNGQAMALSFVTAPNLNKGWSANLYERAKIWFEKSLEDVENTIKDVAKDIKKKYDDLEKASNSKADSKTVDDVKAELQKSIDKLVNQAEKMQDQIDEVETKSGRLQTDNPTAFKSMGQLLHDSLTTKSDKGSTVLDRFKESRNVEFEVKAASTMNTTYAVTAGARIPVWDREPGVAKSPDRNPFILDLITIGATGSNAIEWVERTLREGYAGQTAEGASPALMSMIYNTFNARVKKTAVMLRATTEMLEDVDYLQSEIQTEGLDAMELTIDTQVLSGNNVGENLKGLLSYATAWAKPSGLPTVASANQIDVLNAGTTQVTNALFRPTAYILHPTDLLAIDTRKDANGVYLQYPGYDRANQRLNGLPIVTNVGVTQGDFLLGDFGKSKYVRRKGIIIQIFDQNGTDAETGHIMVRCEARGVHRVKGPDTPAFVKGTFSTAITALSA